MKATGLKWTLIFVLGSFLSLSIGQVHADGIEACDLAGEDCPKMETGKVIHTAQVKQSEKKQDASEAQSSNDRDISSPSITLAKGSDHASITIIEYSDFGCPSCAKASQALNEVMKSYPDEIRVVFKPYPAIATPEALLIHEAALAAGEQGKFWEMHDRLMALKGPVNEEIVLNEAKQLKLNVQRVREALRDHRFQNVVVNQMTEAKGFGVTAAPTFFINGRKLVGARSVGDFKQIIDEELGLTKTVRAPSTPPEEPQIATDINLNGAPWRGTENAPVVIVEFSDFQCPFCARAVPTMHQLAASYPGKIKWAFKHYPLPIHPDAPLAHEAALAAAEQGKFWEMHDLIFSNQQAMKKEDLVRYAQQLNLDLDRFQKDLDTGKYKPIVEADSREGEKLGVSGTPTFFINGRRVVGAMPLQTFQGIIEDELKKAGM